MDGNQGRRSNVWRRWRFQRRDTMVGDAIAAVFGPIAALGIGLRRVLMIVAMVVVWREKVVKPYVKVGTEFEA